MMIAQAVGHAYQPPKLNLLMLSTVPRFPLRRCSEKATGNLKNYRPHRKLIYSQLRPKVRVAAARGSLAFSVLAMNSPRQTLPGFFL